jgi:uncharacterized protein with LGFP repeats
VRLLPAIGLMFLAAVAGLGGAPQPPPPLTVPRIGTNSSRALDDLGDITSEYTYQGEEMGVLGPPRAPTQLTRDGRALVRFYQNGAIYWTPAHGAVAIYGPMLEAWIDAGGENSALGYPVADEVDAESDYYKSQQFEHGMILWNPRDGASIKSYRSNELR